jgi:hypothetical protein
LNPSSLDHAIAKCADTDRNLSEPFSCPADQWSVATSFRQEAAMARNLIVNLAAAAALASTALYAGSAAAYPLGMNPHAPHALNKPKQSGHLSLYGPKYVIGKALPKSPLPISKWKMHPPITTISVPKPKTIIPTPTPNPAPKGPPKFIPVPIPIGNPPADIDVHIWRLDHRVGAVRTTVDEADNCLIKTYTPDAQVIFEDRCTGEIVSAPVDRALSQTSEVPATPNYAGETYQDYLAADPQYQAAQQKN